MAKLVLYVFVALLAASFIMADNSGKRNCGRHGDPVSILTVVHLIFLLSRRVTFTLVFQPRFSRFCKNTAVLPAINKENGERERVLSRLIFNVIEY